MRLYVKPLILILLLSFILGIFSWGAINPYCFAADIEPAAKQENKDQDLVEEAHTIISEQVINAAHWVDSFFGNERSEAESNHTRLKIKLSAFKESGDDLGFNTKFNLRLVLPRFQRRLHLIISGNPDDDENLDNSPINDAKRRFEERDDGNLATALRFFPKVGGLQNLSLDVGLRFRTIVPGFYVGGRYRRLFKLDPWAMRFTQTARWYTDKGAEAKTRLDFDRHIFTDMLFRASTEVAWLDDGEGWRQEYRFFLFQPLSETRVIEYEWNNYFKTDPNYYLDSITLSTKFRQRLWWKWIFLEIVPQLSFRDEHEWKANPGITVRLEFNFGYEPKTKPK